MYYAHLPAGYITSKLLFKKFEQSPVKFNTFAFWGMFGAVAPDFDLLFYYLLDDKHNPHHGYFTHVPFYWFSLLFITLVLLQFDNHRHLNPVLLFIFTCNGFLHMILDTIVGYIFWLEPFIHVDQQTTLEQYIPWDAEFLELFIIIWALYLWKKPQIVQVFSRLGSSLDLIE